MNIKRNIHIALVTAVATVGLSGPAMAFGPAPANTTISNGKPKPVVVWDHAAWKKCWATTYAQWREDGSSPQNATTAADWTCGSAPTK
jgi:hypothetical protein